ncbi:MAG: MFS transporter [Clostridium sp.]|uniref:MFS transporter n=1 Tax=Clostridium sp. TaxID=1506 RepID=UPI002FCA0B84
MSKEATPSTKQLDNDIILGKDLTKSKRTLAFLSIVVIYFFYCYNFMIGTFMKPTMIYDISNGGFGFSLVDTEMIFAVMTFATIPGTFIFGKLATRIGKKKTLIIISLLIGITSYFPLLAPTNVIIWTCSRFVTGLVLGGVFGTAMPLVADMFPSKYRGKLAAIVTSLFSVAMIFGGYVYGILGDENWRTLMYTCIIPPIVGAVLAYIFVPNDAEHAKKAYAEGIKSGEKISYLSMYKGKYLWIGIGTILLSSANFTAYAAFANNSTTYLVDGLGMTAVTAGAIYSFQGIGQTFGYLFWGALADKFGRKVPLIGMALSGISVFAFTFLGANDYTSFCILSVIIGFSIGFSGAWGAYYSELFPPKFRALSAGMSFNGGYIISTFAVPAIVSTANGSAGMTPIFYFAAAVFIAGSVVWAFLPETIIRKKNLDKQISA